MMGDFVSRGGPPAARPAIGYHGGPPKSGTLFQIRAKEQRLVTKIEMDRDRRGVGAELWGMINGFVRLRSMLRQVGDKLSERRGQG